MAKKAVKVSGSVLVMLLMVSVMVGAAAAITLGNFVKLQVYTANTQIQTQMGSCWDGQGNPAYYGQLMDHTDYVASYSPNLIGQQINMQGGESPDGGAGCLFGALTGPIDNYGYRLKLLVPGLSDAVKGTPLASFVPETDTWYGLGGPGDPNNAGGVLLTEPTGSAVHVGGITLAPAVYWNIQSIDGHTIIPSGTVAHGEFWIHVSAPLQAGKWYQLASDEAHVATGVGSSTFDKRLYQVGDTARCHWSIGYISDQISGQGWKIDILSQGQSYKMVAQQQALSTLQGDLSYLITSADWMPSQSKLICQLWNNLWGKDFDAVGVVDNVTLSPSLTVTGVTPQSPKQGDTVGVTWTMAPNPQTKSPIVKVEVMWGWGSLTTDANLSGSATSYNFTAAQSGIVTVVVMAWDQAGRPSASTKLQIQVDHQPVGGGSNVGPPTLTSLWVGVILLAVGLALFFLGWHWTKGLPGFIIAMLGIAVVGIGVYFIGVYLVALVNVALHPGGFIIMLGGLL